MFAEAASRDRGIGNSDITLAASLFGDVHNSQPFEKIVAFHKLNLCRALPFEKSIRPLTLHIILRGGVFVGATYVEPGFMHRVNNYARCLFLQAAK